MKIERLELYGYKRLMLSNIQRFVYTPTAAYQLILGTNGSGKSSILFELSPLPAHASNYSKDGFKDIQLSHRGHDYRLVSTFKSGNKHSFLKNGEELNPGGTGQVQKELVRREFGITPELHELLTGEARFTDMAPMQRREWITQLSSVDYTYAIGVFNRLRTVARDNQGALKHIRQRLTKETNDLKALSELDGLEEKARNLRDELNALLTARTPGLPSYQTLEPQVDTLLERIERFSKSIVDLQVPMPAGSRYQSLGDVESDLRAMEGDVGATQTLLDRITTEYSDLESLIRTVVGENGIEVENIEPLILSVEEELSLLESSSGTFSTIEDPEDVLRDTRAVLDEIISLFSQLPNNADRRFSRDTIQQARDRIRENSTNVDKGCARLSAIEARLTLINSAKDTTCPKCNYVWREGYSQEEIAKLESWSKEHDDIVEQAKKAIAADEAFLEEADQYLALYNRFRGYVSGYPRLKVLWDYILENQFMFNDPQSKIDIFYVWGRDVELATKRHSLEVKLQHLHELALRQSQAGGNVHFHQRLEKLREEIEITTGTLQSMKRKVKDTRQYYDRLQQLSTASASLEAAVQELHKLQSTVIDALRNQAIDGCTERHQNDLAMIQRQLTDKQALEGIVKDLERDQREVDIDFQAAALLAQALSPTDGIVAEQLTGFISCLVAQINSIIASVWTYDLFVLPCGMESGGLDYKFPLQVRAADNIVPDVSRGSTAQREIVNFAFQLTVMLYMDLTGYPLYLDELGAGFDEQHRVNVMNFVKQLMDVNQHSQLFMISHYAANHGALTSAQILVLDGSNIAVPGEHNNHVAMT